MLSKKIIAGEIKPNDTITIDYENNNYIIKNYEEKILFFWYNIKQGKE